MFKEYRINKPLKILRDLECVAHVKGTDRGLRSRSLECVTVFCGECMLGHSTATGGRTLFKSHGFLPNRSGPAESCN